MAYYKPCKNCAVEKGTCDTRARLSEAIAGQYVTSINFRCSARTPMFQQGQRVQFTWSHYEPNDEGDSDENRMLFKGTVLEEKGLRFIVRVDDEESEPADDRSEGMDPKHVFRNDRLIIKVKPADMLALDEPDRQICAACTAYPDEDDRCQGFGDLKRWDSYWPTECLRRPSNQEDSSNV